MKVFKNIDWSISTALITWFVLDRCWEDIDRLINAYFIVGGWQVISMIVHAILWPPRKYSVRRIYHWIALISVVTMPMGSFWILAALAPFMAAFYTILCITETFSIKTSPTTLLK